MKNAFRESQTLRACLCRRGPSSISLPNLKGIAQFLQKLLRYPEIRKLGHVAQATPIYGTFMVPTQGGSVLCVRTKFEADSSFHSKVIRGVPNFAPPQTPFPGTRDGQNLISWRWSLLLPTRPVWWRSMQVISSCRGNRHRPPVANAHKQDR